MTGQFKSLKVERIVEQTGVLHKRITERFPNSGLSKVVAEVLEVAQTTKERSVFVRQPIIWLRVLIFLLIAVIVFGVIGTLVSIGAPEESLEFFTFVQLVESGINDVVFIGFAIFFLSSLESRLKRKRAMEAIDELRSLAHIIDMHQLTKDPEHYSIHRIRTPSSPEPLKDLHQLKRYLDYCTESLSLIGKLAAVYAQSLNDQIVLTAVNEIEDLTTGLSGKIWQKIMVVQSIES